MKLLAAGCNFQTAPVGLRERLAFSDEQLAAALEVLNTRHDCEAAVLSTCNRVEVYLARPGAEAPESELVAGFLGDFHGVAAHELRTHLYGHVDAEAVRHLFRVTSGLDSLVVGEGQITGQVRRAYEAARRAGTAGPALHALFQQALRTAGRVRHETGIARGHASVPSAAVDYVREVFERFDDKAVLVIGAGKMGGLTLRHLRGLGPGRIWVTNRSPAKATEVAAGCGGTAVPWEILDDVLARADIILSTTGALEPVVTLERFARVKARRAGGPLVILDIAVPRDFDPRIHDGESTCVFNIDDLKHTCDRTLRERLKHVGPAEAIIEQERRRFLSDWNRRRHGAAIARLTQEFEAKRHAVVKQLMNRLGSRLSEDERDWVEGAFRLYQNQCLHGPITALAEDASEGSRHTLLEAMRKLFGLSE
jgi:glutamyl-tRNA reductase